MRKMLIAKKKDSFDGQEGPREESLQGEREAVCLVSTVQKSVEAVYTVEHMHVKCISP